MISNSKEAAAGEEGAVERICGNCKHWRMFMLNRQTGQALGVCAKEMTPEQVEVGEESLAPYGIATGHFAGCEEYEQRELQKVIKVPGKVLDKLDGKGKPGGRLRGFGAN